MLSSVCVNPHNEKQTGLVHVIVVLIDHDNLDCAGRVMAPQSVGTGRSPGSATEDDDPFGHGPIVEPLPRSD